VGLLLLVVAQAPDDDATLQSVKVPAGPREDSNTHFDVEHYKKRAAFESGDEEIALDVEEKVFWLLVVTVEKLMPPEMYGASLEGAQIAQEVLWKWLLGERGHKFGVSKVARWVDNMESDGNAPKKKPGSRRGAKYGNAGSNSGMPPLSMVTT
jgi:hypothetical protein